MPFGGVKYHGMFFIAYTNNPTNIEKQLVRMIGNDGPADAILQFSRAVSGNYWYVPSLDKMKVANL
jgi:putative iron-dependent peroxidase